MKTLKTLGLSATVAVLLAAGWATRTVLAQTTVNTTTLTNALSAPISGANSGANTATGANNTFAVGSTANILAGYEIFIDQEAMLVISVPSSGNVTVQRGYDATVVASHAASSTVYIGRVSGTNGSPFQYTDPPFGTCTIGNEPFSIRINVVNGRIWTCSTRGWRSSLGPSGFPFYSGQTAGTGKTTLTAAQSGATFLFDAASGNNYVLPAPLPGLTFDFIQTVTVTSNSAEIQTDAATTFIQGVVHIAISGGATGSDWACNGTSHLAIKQNGTTSGGILGGRLHFVAVGTTLWQVDGLTIGSGVEVTPCNTTA